MNHLTLTAVWEPLFFLPQCQPPRHIIYNRLSFLILAISQKAA